MSEEKRFDIFCTLKADGNIGIDIANPEQIPFVTQLGIVKFIEHVILRSSFNDHSIKTYTDDQKKEP